MLLYKLLITPDQEDTRLQVAMLTPEGTIKKLGILLVGTRSLEECKQIIGRSRAAKHQINKDFRETIKNRPKHYKQVLE